MTTLGVFELTVIILKESDKYVKNGVLEFKFRKRRNTCYTKKQCRQKTCNKTFFVNHFNIPIKMLTRISIRKIEYYFVFPLK